MKNFKDLTLRGQKMRIVNDAIKQIESGIIKAQQDIYFAQVHEEDLYRKGSLKKILETANTTVCEACAKGTLFVACVLNVNKVDIDNYRVTEESFQTKKLSKWFSAKELDMIETAFEQAIIRDSTNCLQTEYRYTDLAHRCIKFGCKYKTDKKRMLAILNNIAVNGEFKP